MEESERPTEFVEEQIHHQALHSKGDRTAWVAVTTAILAALAAVGSLLSIEVIVKKRPRADGFD
jgi:hypothetical protein